MLSSSGPTSRRQVLGGALAGAASLGLASFGLAACSSTDGDSDAGPRRADPSRSRATGGPSTSTVAAASAPVATAGPTSATTAAPQATPAPSGDPTISTGRTKVVVLGSQGGQQVTQLTGANVRCGSSILLDVDGEVTVLDCGCGSMHRLAEAGYDANQVTTVLVTHCHMDHVADLGSFASFAWSSGRNGDARARRLDVYGPTGLADYEHGLKRSLKRTIADQEGPLGQQPTFADFATFHELTPPRRRRQVLDRPNLRVDAIRVNHGSIPAVGYRIRTPDLDLVFSGDRGATGDGFVEFAAGADVLFHEVIHRDLVVTNLRAQDTAETFIEHLIDDHTDAPDVGRAATAAGVPALVLYHLIPGNPLITDEMWTDLVRPTYDGRIIVAKDLLVV